MAWSACEAPLSSSDLMPMGIKLAGIRRKSTSEPGNRAEYLAIRFDNSLTLPGQAIVIEQLHTELVEPNSLPIRVAVLFCKMAYKRRNISFAL